MTGRGGWRSGVGSGAQDKASVRGVQVAIPSAAEVLWAGWGDTQGSLPFHTPSSGLLMLRGSHLPLFLLLLYMLFTPPTTICWAITPSM